MTEIERGKTLLTQARHAIASQLGQTASMAETPLWLLESGATFVTLTQQGQLRGCIGSLEAHRSLLEDVRHNAIAAAFHDPRFTPLILKELALTQVEVSLLSAHEALNFASEEEALAQLRPGIDGVILQYGHHRSTFLPQVWEQLPSPAQFMAHLKRKAGLSEQFWADALKLSRYTVSKWKEPDDHDSH
ncbi:MAG: AmmeMemoRadiSam system protein A [Methylophilaceae bacterium]